jgi:hypothetical protein
MTFAVPAGPCGPVGPVGPVAPVGPAGPAGPAGPSFLQEENNIITKQKKLRMVRCLLFIMLGLGLNYFTINIFTASL